MKKLLIVAALLFSNSWHCNAETYGSIFSRCVVDTMRNNPVPKEKAWEVCETIAHDKRTNELYGNVGVTTGKPYLLDDKFWASVESKPAEEAATQAVAPNKSTDENYAPPASQGYSSSILKGISSAVGAAILASLILLIRSKPWTWRIQGCRLAIARFFSSADTKQKRMFLAATPAAASIGGWLLIQDTNWLSYFDDIRFITMVFIVMSISFAIAGLTKVVDWINGEN